MPAAKGNCYNPEGRTPKPIDWKLFEEYCGLHCTLEEIAGLCRIDKNNLIDRVRKQYNEEFATVYQKFSSDGKCSLRRRQVALSNKNAAMAIWLGKQLLGQKENTPESTVSEEVLKSFTALMQQLGGLQQKTIEENKSSSDPIEGPA